MFNNPLAPQDLLTLASASAEQKLGGLNLPEKYIYATPVAGYGFPAWRLFDAAYISTGIIDPNRLGTGATGAGNLYLADDGTWKPVSSIPGSQNLQQVTDLGNTTTNTIDTAGTKSDYFLLDTLATPTLQAGMFGWNDVDGTANLRLKGNNVTLQVGQETLARVVNKTGADLLESQYKVVRVRVASEGGAQGQRLAVVLAQGDNDPDSATTLGLVTENIPNNQEGFITIFGNVNGINTTGSLQGETWVDGDVLYLSPTTPGGLTKVKPQAPDHTLIVGYVVYAHNNQGKIFVKVDNGYELDELHNVLINGVANNDLLQYDGTTQVWKNKTISAIFGGTPLVSVPTLAQVTTAGNTTSNSLIYTGTTEAIRPNVDLVGILGTSIYRFNVVYSRELNSGASSMFLGGANLSVTDTIGSVKFKVFGTTGNVTIQNGGTHVDAGYRLDVTGNTRVTSNVIIDGSLGIGTNTPTAKYHQYQGQGIMARYDISTANANQNRGVWDFYTNAAVAPDFFGRFGFKFEGGTADSFKQFQLHIADSVIPKMVVTGGGLLGLGTTSPTYKVDVQGTTLAASSVSVQGAFNIARVPAPTGTLTLTPSAGGSVDVGQHYYFVTFTTALGETNTALSTAITIVSGSQTVTLTGIPVSTDPRVTGRKIYRTRAGQTSDRGMVIATIADNTTTSYVDTAADSTFPNLGDWGAYRDNTTSRQITIDGTKAMALGTGVTAIGFGAGASVTTAGLTTLVGYNAGNAITYGFQNTLVGTLAGRFVTTGSGNTVLGAYSLMAVTTGSDNIAVGRGASFYNVTGSYNIAIGGGALSGQSGVSHNSNIGIGASALSNLGAADNNVAIGYYAGRYISNGSNNTLSFNSIFIGYDARPNANSEANQIVIGYNGRGLGANTTVIGNSSTTFTSIPAGNMTIGGTTNAGYKLDVQGNTRVAGSVEVGANSAVQGGLSLYQKYTSSTNFLGSISTEYGSGAMILGYGAVGKAGVAGYVSSFDNFTGFRSAIKIGQNTPLIVLGTSSAVATTVGSDITMSTLFQITNAGNVGIGSGNPSQKLDVVGSAKVRGATFFGAISQPSPPTLITNSTTGGTLAAATYYYRIVSVDFFGNTTTPSNELAVTTAGSTSSITLSWPLVQGAYQYRIYRGTTSGGQNTYYTLSGTNSTSFTDTGAAGTAGTTPAENLTSYGYYNTNGDFRSGNILIVNNGVGNTSSIIFDKSTDGPQINVTEYVNDGTLFEFSLRDNPDGPDAFHFVMPDWQNPSSGWKPFKFAAFTTQIVGQNTNFWSSFSMPSSTPYYTTNPESVANSQIKWDPYTSTTYNLLRDNGTGTGTLNVDVTGFTGTTNTIYWVTIASPTTFNWGLGWSGGTASGTGVTITGGWQVLGNGIQIRLTGTFVAADRWAFRVFPVPRMGIGTTTPTAPLQVSTTIAAVSGTARGVYFNPTLVAAANNDVLVGLDIAPTFTNGAFTGVKNYALRLGGNLEFTNQNFIISSAGGITRLNYNGGVGYSLVTDNTSTPFRFIHNTSNEVMRIFGATGNLLLQNGGTFTDAGYRLDVNGTARVVNALTAGSFVKSGGTSNQFLKADGSVDSSTYLTSFTETDPVFVASAAYGITATNITNWNTAYGWGNHASAGYATTSYVTTQINNLINGAPGALDTLNELAAALGNDANFSTTVTNSLATKVGNTRNLTINGTTYDLSADRSWTIATDIQTSANGGKITTPVNVGANTIATINATTYEGATFNYVLDDGTNFRAGTVIAVWTGTTVQFTETTTNDIGNTNAVTMSVTISGANAQLVATSSTPGWTAKVIPIGI